MSLVAARADLHRGPAQLQEHGRLAEEHLTGSAQGGGFHKRQRGQRAEQHLIGHSSSLSLHLQLL